MLRIIVCLLLCLPLMGAGMLTEYVASNDSDVATTVRTLTIVGSATRVVRLIRAKIYCENECDVAQIIGAVASSGTGVTLNVIRPGTRAASGTATKQATITGGTTITSDVVPGGTILILDLSGYVLYGTAQTFTLSSASVSDRVIFAFEAREEDR